MPRSPTQPALLLGLLLCLSYLHLPAASTQLDLENCTATTLLGDDVDEIQAAGLNVKCGIKGVTNTPTSFTVPPGSILDVQGSEGAVLKLTDTVTVPVDSSLRLHGLDLDLRGWATNRGPAAEWLSRVPSELEGWPRVPPLEEVDIQTPRSNSLAGLVLKDVRVSLPCDDWVELFNGLCDNGGVAMRAMVSFYVHVCSSPACHLCTPSTSLLAHLMLRQVTWDSIDIKSYDYGVAAHGFSWEEVTFPRPDACQLQDRVTITGCALGSIS
jgi:hypothetical protein